MHRDVRGRVWLPPKKDPAGAGPRSPRARERAPRGVASQGGGCAGQAGAAGGRGGGGPAGGHAHGEQGLRGRGGDRLRETRWLAPFVLMCGGTIEMNAYATEEYRKGAQKCLINLCAGLQASSLIQTVRTCRARLEASARCLRASPLVVVQRVTERDRCRWALACSP